MVLKPPVSNGRCQANLAALQKLVKRILALDYPYGTVQKTLAQRFGCRKTQRKMFGGAIKFDSSVVVMEVDSFKDNAEFAELMEYINTATDKQQKGAGGGVK